MNEQLNLKIVSASKCDSIRISTGVFVYEVGPRWFRW